MPKETSIRVLIADDHAILRRGLRQIIEETDDLTVVANWLGVDRGTDLMLYGLVVAFVFTTLSTWVRFREQELRYARLARAVALQNAVKPEDSLEER